MVLGEYFDTAIGRLYVAVEDGCVVRLTGGEASAGGVVVSKDEIASVSEVERALHLLRCAITEITEYLEGKRTDFDIPVCAKGTAFQKKVWDALQKIPYGETRSYGEIARAAGSPKGARAVGMACNRNPIMILIPCHRVIGSCGKLVGFGGGLEMKEYLLGIEKED